jgi:argininosuccinate lyase
MDIMMDTLLLVESNSTGTGPLFARRARELGAEPVLMAAEPDRYAYARQDGIRVLEVDTTDLAAMLRVAGSLRGRPCGVTSSSEYYIPVAAELARRLGRPGPDPVAVARCRNKATQRADLAAGGVPVPGYAAAQTVAAAVAGADRIGYPVVVKPADGSGSVGVLHCADRVQVADHAARLLATTTNERDLPVARQVLVEWYADGPEFSVEVFGDAVIAVVAKHLGPAPHFVETGHDMPAELPAEQDAVLRHVALRAVAALRLGFGAAHVEIRLTTAGSVLIEVNPRLAGGMIPELIRSAVGIDLVTAQVAAAMGRAVPLGFAHAAHASLRFLTADGPAVLGDGQAALADACRLPGIVEARLYRGHGERLGRARDFRDRIGHVRSAAPTGAASRAAADAALDRLRAALQPLREGVPR